MLFDNINKQFDNFNQLLYLFNIKFLNIKKFTELNYLIIISI